MKDPKLKKRYITGNKVKVRSKPSTMLSKTVVAQIVDLRKQNHTKSSIARITGASRTTVNKYLDNPKLVGHKTGRPSYLEPDKDLVKKCFLLCKGNCAAAMVLFKEKLKELGKSVTFKARTFRQFCKQWRDLVKDLKSGGRAYERYETSSGVQMQTDFFTTTILIDAKPTVIHGFIAELSFSRKLFCKLFDVESTPTWINVEIPEFVKGPIP